MRTAWERAIHDADLAALAQVLDAGGDIDARDRYGQTALMLAAMHGHGEVVEWLIVHGAALDYTSKSSLSALMLAVVNGHRDTARLLIAAGADVTLRGSGSPGFAGKTARDLARARGDDELERFLEGDHTV